MPGFSSHVIGSHNLDMGLAADLDGDGRLKPLVPSQDGTELGAIRRTAVGAVVAWTVPLDGRLSTNMAAITLSDGSLAVGAGRSDGVLRLWLSETRLGRVQDPPLRSGTAAAETIWRMVSPCHAHSASVRRRMHSS